MKTVFTLSNKLYCFILFYRDMSNTCGNNESVQVFCRVRPSTNHNESNECIIIENDTTIHTNPPSTSNAYRSGAGREYNYSFSYVFDAQSSQSDIFKKVAYPLVKNMINGQNGLIFTYGVTGSGKTFTMQVRLALRSRLFSVELLLLIITYSFVGKCKTTWFTSSSPGYYFQQHW